MKHHRKHNEEDNQSYAFLNGMSDFILDAMAKKFYDGYRNYSDLHAKAYVGKIRRIGDEGVRSKPYKNLDKISPIIINRITPI